MPDNQAESQGGNITYNYTIERARVIYDLLEKPADMSDHEWAIVSDEGFRKYLASQLRIAYVSRQDLKR